MTKELLPCPFCGSPAQAIDNSYQTYWCMCTNEDCLAAMGEVGVNSPEEAAARWNRRPVEPTCAHPNPYWNATKLLKDISTSYRCPDCGKEWVEVKPIEPTVKSSGGI